MFEHSCRGGLITQASHFCFEIRGANQPLENKPCSAMSQAGGRGNKRGGSGESSQGRRNSKSSNEIHQH